MRSIKPKKLSKALEQVLEDAAALMWKPSQVAVGLSSRECGEVLAALEYERQRADGKLAVDAPLRCACGHLQRNHFKAGEFACKVANCGCPRFVGV